MWKIMTRWTTFTSIDMTQQHGFDFESLIIEAITNSNAKDYKSLQKSGHTSIFDIEKGKRSSTNYSIKASKDGKYVWTSDILRFYDCTKMGDFSMIVGCWRQTTKGKEFDNLFVFQFKSEHHNLIWNGLSRKEIEKFCDYVKNIPFGYDAQQKHSKIWKEKRNDILKRHLDCIVSINAKIDSGTQRRVQSGMRIKDLIDRGIPHRQYEKQYNGLLLPLIID